MWIDFVGSIVGETCNTVPKKGLLSRDTVDENAQLAVHADQKRGTVSVTTPSPKSEVFVGGIWWLQNHKSTSGLERNRCPFFLNNQN